MGTVRTSTVGAELAGQKAAELGVAPTKAAREAADNLRAQRDEEREKTLSRLERETTSSSSDTDTEEA